MQFFSGLITEISAQKERLFLWLPVMFGIGILFYFALPFEPIWWAGAVLIAGASLPVWRLYPRHHDSAGMFLAYIVAAAIFTSACGFYAAQAGTGLYGTNIIEKKIGATMAHGRVEQIEKKGGSKDGSKIVLRVIKLEKTPPKEIPKKIRITIKKDEGLKAGDEISILVSLSPPSRAVIPNGYDFRRHLFFEGIGAVGFSLSAPTIIEKAKKGAVENFFENTRKTIAERIHAQAGGASAGIMNALITGQRAAIDEDDDNAMRDSGLYHLLSISGTHVGMVAAVLFFTSRLFMAFFPWIALHWPIKKIAAVLALSGAAFYVFLAGAEVPALRALLTTALVMIAIMLDRSPLSLRLVAFSALVVLITLPHSILGVSFQMSFAAVAALICFFDYIRVWWMKWYARAGFFRKSAMYMIGVLMTSIIAGGVTGLFSLYHFQSFSVYGVLSNMLAVPLTGVIIMPAAIGALMLMPFGLDGFALKIMEWGCVWMLSIAHWAGGLDGAVLRASQWPPLSLLFISLGVVFFLLWRGWRGKGLAIIILCIGVLIGVSARPYDVLISETGKLVAFRAEENLVFSKAKGEGFARENWMRFYGMSSVEKPKVFKDTDSGVLCDDDGCRFEVKGRKISVVRSRRALNDDCAWADLLIADFPVWEGQCAAKRVVDLMDVKKRGAHGARFFGEGVRIFTAGGGGEKPWD